MGFTGNKNIYKSLILNDFIAFLDKINYNFPNYFVKYSKDFIVGGYGSGRYGWSTTDKLNSCLKLNLKTILKGYQSGSLSWSRNKKEFASIAYSRFLDNPDDMYIRLFYSITPRNQEAISLDYQIQVITTPANFGGHRFWFICPVTFKKASVLYSSSRYQKFVSRHAIGLLYESQSENYGNRLITKKEKIEKKLGGENCYKKPKGMHQRTYDKSLNQFFSLEEKINNYMIEILSAIKINRQT